MDDLKNINWNPAQSMFLSNAADPGIRIAALSAPRGWGKTSLLGELIRRVMTPSHKMHAKGSENLLIAASLKNARPAFLMARAALGDDEYRYQDSAIDCGILHRKSRTRLSLRACNPKTLTGIVGTRFVFLDECGSWELRPGELIWDLLTSAQGKAGSPLKLILSSTLAPYACRSGHWFHDFMTAKPADGIARQLIQGRPEIFTFKEARRVNPLIDKAILKAEFKEAKKDTRKHAAFSSYRLNRPVKDEQSQLFTPQEWQSVKNRKVGDRRGTPSIGVDLGGSRSWSAACAIYPSGLMECFALTGDKPSIEARETRDRVPKGTYTRLVESGSLILEPERTAPTVRFFLSLVKERWPTTRELVCDFFKLQELRDIADQVWPSLSIVTRRARWSDSSYDISAARELALDGNLSIAKADVELLTESLASGMVETDSSGNSRLIKYDFMTSRDDPVAAMVLACGAFKRRLNKPKPVQPFSFLYLPSAAGAV